MSVELDSAVISPFHNVGENHEKPIAAKNTDQTPVESTAVNNHPATFYYLQEGESLRKGHEGPVSLRDSLYNGSREIHTKARANDFLVKLTKGDVCPEGYNKYLRNLGVLHGALEEAQTIIEQAVPGAGHFIFREIWRSGALAKDMATWEALDQRHEPESVSVKYAEGLIEQAKTNPLKVLGVMYALYGTIFSGGQIIRPKVHDAFIFRRDLLMPDAEKDPNPNLGVEFFSFPFGTAVFKRDTWHVHLNELPEKIGKTKEQLYQTMIEGTNEAMSAVLAFIEAFTC